MTSPLVLHSARAALLVLLVVACTTQQPAPTSAPPTDVPPASPTPGLTGPPTPAPTDDPAGSPTPLPSDVPQSPSPAPDAAVDSAAEAAARVLGSDPMFYGISPIQPELAGQCCWYRADDLLSHYVVRVEVGWGDCPAGCINRHEWVFQVDRDGTVALLDEGGDAPVEREGTVGSGPGTVAIIALAGPTCPVEPFPPDPACAPRPVGGAAMVVFDAFGREIARASTDEQGVLALQLAEGAYYVEPEPAEGTMLPPEPIAFSVVPGGHLGLRLDYDTGIR